MIHSISLDNFEQSIDNKILEKGLQYFRSGKVMELTELSRDEYQAEIQGTSSYTLTFNLKNREFSNYVCSCPYVDGPVCKHAAAVLFYLMKDELGLSMAKPRKKNASVAKVKVKKLSPAEKAAEIIHHLSPELLKEILLSRINDDKELLIRILEYSDDDKFNELRQEYKKEIGKIIQAQKSRGFIQYSGSRKIGMALQSYSNQAIRAKEQGKVEKAAAIAVSLIEKIIPTYNYCDDSSAYMSTHVDVATNILKEICEKELPENLRLDIIGFCKESFVKEWFKGWDWEIEALEIAVSLSKTIPEGEEFLQLLSKADVGKYSFYKIVLLQAHILFRLKRDAEAMELLEDHALENEVGQNLLSIYLEDKKYDLAFKLVDASIQHADKFAKGLIGMWAAYGFQVAQAKKDIKLMEEYIHTMFTNSFSTGVTMKKQIIEEFGEAYFKEKLNYYFQLKTDGNSYMKGEAMAQEIANNGSISELWEVVKTDMGSLLRSYEPVLIAHYPKEITAYRMRHLKEEIRRTTGSQSALIASAILRKYLKTGDRETVLECIEYLKTTYSNRPTLLAALQKL